MNDNEFREADNDPDSDYIIDQVLDDERSLAYGLYSKIKSYQFHYNSVKIRYKMLSATWLLATFIAFGYLLGGQETGLPMNQLIATGLLSLLSAMGLFLLFFLDVAIYHRLIEALFIGTIELEKKFPFLTKTNQNIAALLIRGSTGPVVFDGLFYAYFVFILLLISNISFYLSFYQCYFFQATVFGIVYFIINLMLSSAIVHAARESGVIQLFRRRKRKK